jgi:hypothetical protein
MMLVNIARADNTAGKVGLVDRVRKLLGLQTETTMLPVHGSVLSGQAGIISAYRSPLPETFYNPVLMETDSSFSIILSLISEGNKLECGKRQQFIIYISAGILEIEVIEIETH